MYSINADDYHRPSVLRRDRSHPILLLKSHGQVNSTERLNPQKPKQSAAQRMTLSKSCESQDVTLVGVIGKRVSGFIPQTPRRSPEEHNSARGKMPRRVQVSY